MRIISFIKDVYQDAFDEELVVVSFLPRRTLIPIMHKWKNYKVWYSITPGISFKCLTSTLLPIKYKLWYLSVVLFIRPLIHLK
jgi:hypothetical protein